MSSSDIRNQNKLKWILSIVIVIILLTIVMLSIGYVFFSDSSINILLSNQNSSNISMDKVSQISSKAGVRQWNLDAKSAQFFQETQKVFFQDLSVIMFINDNDKDRIYLKADQGVLKTDTNDMEVYGNVNVKHGHSNLTTDKLHYNHKDYIIYSKSQVKIYDDLSEIVADSVSFNLHDDKMTLTGNVKAIFNESFKL